MRHLFTKKYHYPNVQQKDIKSDNDEKYLIHSKKYLLIDKTYFKPNTNASFQPHRGEQRQNQHFSELFCDPWPDPRCRP